MCARKQQKKDGLQEGYKRFDTSLIDGAKEACLQQKVGGKKNSKSVDDDL